LQAAVALHAAEDDIALEYGCQLGATTALLAARCRQVIGVDLARSLDVTTVRGTSSRSHATAAEAGLPPNVRLEVLDLFDILALQAACPEPISLIVIDISSVLGADMPLAALALCRQLERLFAPSLRAVVIKSKAVARLERSLITGAALLAAGRGAPPDPAQNRNGSDQNKTGLDQSNNGSQLAQNRTEAVPGAPSLPSKAMPWRVVGTLGVSEYRAAALRLLEIDLPLPARVLEIGCHMGTTTAIIDRRARELGGGSAIGVDVSDSIIDRARALHPTVSFLEADAWDVTAIQEVGRGASLLLLDVGGVSSAHAELDAVALISQLRSALPLLRAVVVKSHCVRSLAIQLRPWRNIRGLGPRQAAEQGAAAAAAAAKLEKEEAASNGEGPGEAHTLAIQLQPWRNIPGVVARQAAGQGAAAATAAAAKLEKEEAASNGEGPGKAHPLAIQLRPWRNVGAEGARQAAEQGAAAAAAAAIKRMEGKDAAVLKGGGWGSLTLGLIGYTRGMWGRK
jgi:SAM-dependent methyltransferase